ncbi:flavin reductase family protein [Streptomyces sp. NPDC054786]
MQAPLAPLPASIDPATYRDVLGHFCSGITVVTAIEETPEGGRPVGFTCQSFASLSLDPPLVTCFVNRTSTTWPRIAAAGAFSVNVLAGPQEELCRAFAASGTDKFAGVEWTPAAATGSPRLAGSLAWIDCTIETVHPGGDHRIVVGRVRALDVGLPGAAAQPLLYYRAAFHRIAA